jgi:hypothetical protein
MARGIRLAMLEIRERDGSTHVVSGCVGTIRSLRARKRGRSAVIKMERER